MASYYIGAYYYLSLMDSVVTADKVNIRNFTNAFLANVFVATHSCPRLVLRLLILALTPISLPAMATLSV